MKTNYCLFFCILLLGFLFGGLDASAQVTSEAPAPETLSQTLPQRAQQQTAYLADMLQLHNRQLAALQAAVQARLDAAEMLNNMLFTSNATAAAAYEAIDYRFYAAVGKVLTPAQFHTLLLLDEKAQSAENTLVAGRR